MGFKQTISWTFLTILFLSVNTSCQNFDRKQNAFSTANHPRTEIDTNLWLKETRGIRDILEDSQGNLWFSSTGYVAKFDGKKMVYFSKDDGLSITGNIQKDNNGTIWIENGFQAFRYDGERFLEESIDHMTGYGLWIQPGLNPADTSYLEPGLYEVGQKTTAFHPLPVTRNIDNKFLHLPTTKALFGKDGTVWIGTMESVYGFKNKSFTVISRKEMGRQNDERKMGIRGIFVDSNGLLWMADNGAGVFVYDGKTVENFTKKHHLDEGNVNGNTLHRAFSIAEDTLGNMWFGTVYSGIWMYNPKTEKFKNYTRNDGVKSDNIWTISRTSKGELLFAGETPSAVYRFNGEGFERIY